MDISNSIIVITAAGSVLGSALAERVVLFGAKVVLVDNHYQPLLDTYQRCKAFSTQVHYYFIDDYDHHSITSLLDFVQLKFDQAPDVVINTIDNKPLPSIIDDNPVELFTCNVATMASTLFSLVQMSSERMRLQHKEGVIVNIVPNTLDGEEATYSNGAAMVSGFTQLWAQELSPYNIRVGAVLPTQAAMQNRNHLSQVIDEYVRNTEYIVENEYFSGRVMSA